MLCPRCRGRGVRRVLVDAVVEVTVPCDEPGCHAGEIQCCEGDRADPSLPEADELAFFMDYGVGPSWEDPYRVVGYGVETARAVLPPAMADEAGRFAEAHPDASLTVVRRGPSGEGGAP